MHMTRFALILVSGLALILGGGINGHASAEQEPDSLYIGDGGDNSVKRFDATTGAYLGTFVNSNSGLDGPRGIIFVAGKLLLVNQNVDRPFPGEILKYSRQTGQFPGALVPCNPPSNRTCDRHAPFAPRGLIRGLGHTLYVADLGDFTTTNPGRVAHFDTITGAFLGNLDLTGFTGQFFPRGVVFGPDDRLYVSVVGNLDAGDGLTGSILRSLAKEDIQCKLELPASSRSAYRNLLTLHRPSSPFGRTSCADKHPYFGRRQAVVNGSIHQRLSQVRWSATDLVRLRKRDVPGLKRWK
jgi:hypothetical protein